ncbi:GTP-dependent nucleic acid-binding protein engD [Phytophthora cinnamomi]|uniref:GTP-dependent nucleic acid-binding protein engD n=1 Tax=Phytophthora cinnamomi TaxID=4785 RepID=UPI00355A7075|nr:GTP-dependent nucleic acid-binding protein engD [Phytophthora cinnamomi]
MAPLLNEKDDGLSAAAHRGFLADMLPRDFGKQLNQCVFISGDNCSVNRRLATLVGVPLVGCASHRLNRAVQQQLEDKETHLAEVQALMVKLRTLTQSAKLRLKTDLRPVIRQDIRWNSTFSMLHRYFQLLEHHDRNDDDIADMLSAPACNRSLRSMYKKLKDVESASNALQGSDVDLLDVREWFDGLIAENPQYASYLGPRADIVHSPDFESGCVRVLRGKTDRLTWAEKAAVVGLT